MLKNTAVADDQDDWRLIKNTPQDRLEVNAHSTPQWNYTPEGVLASSPQVGLGGAGLGLRSSELYLKCICSKKRGRWPLQVRYACCSKSEARHNRHYFPREGWAARCRTTQRYGLPDGPDAHRRVHTATNLQPTEGGAQHGRGHGPVSYTHLTLPTILLV